MKFIDWLDERLAVRELVKVMLTEYYVPKNINFYGVLVSL
jgi:hypothetical protein